MPLARSQGLRPRRRLAAALALLLTGAGLVAADEPAAADGTALVAEPFTGSSAADPTWTAFGDACLTAATGGASGRGLGRCGTSSGSPTAGVEPGYLQLTDTASQGALLLDRPLPTAGGLQVEFAQYQYGGSGADGIGFVLVDGSAPLTGAGPSGGSLGYATTDGIPGLPHAYLGLGLDSFGNYSTQVHLGGPDCSRDLGGYSPDTIALRGPGNGTDGYCLLATRRVSDVEAGASLRGPTPAAGETDLSAQRRLVRVVLSPTTVAQPLPEVTWWIDFSGTGDRFVEVGSTRMPSAPPATVKPGFTASVGGLNDVHLIRDVWVSTLQPLAAVDLRTGVDRAAVSGTDRSRFTAGDAVPVRVDVANRGAVTLHALEVADPRAPDLSCPSTTLPPADTVSCTGTIIVTEEDAQAGSLTATATATATNEYGDVRATASTAVTTYTASLRLEASASPDAVTAAGQTIHRSFVVTNTGSVALTGVEVAPADGGPVVTCPSTTLTAGGSETCTDAVTTTQADQEAGSITGTAIARGTIDGRTVRSPEASWAVVASPLPSLELTTTAASGPLDAPDQHVTFSMLVRNTGNLALTDLAVEPSGTGPAIVCPVVALPVGASTTCTAEDVTTQDDVEAGTVEIAARARARTRTGTAVASPKSAATVAVARTASIALSASATPARVSAAGQRVLFAFTVANTGSTRLTGVQLAPVQGADRPTPLALSCPSTTLEVGAVATCTATGAATQDDVDRGGFAAAATASATAVTGPVSSPSATAAVGVDPAPGLSLAASAAPVQRIAEGREAVFSFRIRNTGTVTLRRVSIDLRAFSGDGPPPSTTCPPAAARLAPGDAATCTATYDLSQADLDADGVRATAVATATTPTGSTVESPADDAASASSPAAALALKASAAPSIATTAGQPVRYTFAVTNIGHRTLRDLAVAADPGVPAEVRCPEGPLAPGATATCTGESTTTQADADAGGIRSSAVASATPAGGGRVSSAAAAVLVQVRAASSLAVQASARATRPLVVGTAVRYAFDVVNTGGTTLRGVAIDAAARTGSASPLVVRCPGAAALLAPNERVRCIAEARLIRADLATGRIEQTAVALADGPAGPVRSASTVAAVTVPASPGLPPAAAPKPRPTPVATAPARPARPRTATVPAALTLSAAPTSPGEYRAAGDRLRYAFTVTNSGSVTVAGVRIEGRSTGGAARLTAVECAATEIAPGARTRCTAVHTVSQQDVDAERLRAVVVAVGTALGAAVASTPVEVATTSAGTSHLVLTMASTRAGTAARVRVGDMLAWTIRVLNTGTRTVHGLAVSDGAGGRVECPTASLAPGAAMECTAPQHAVTAADLAAGRITRTATASAIGTRPTTSGPVSTSLPAVQERAATASGQQDAPAPDLLPWLIGGLTVPVLASAAVVAARRRRRRNVQPEVPTSR